MAIFRGIFGFVCKDLDIEANTYRKDSTMSAVDTPTVFEYLSALLPDDAPEVASVDEIAAIFGLARGTVFYAVKTGKVPTVPRAAVGGVAYGIRPLDALLVWGHRLRPAHNHP